MTSINRADAPLSRCCWTGTGTRAGPAPDEAGGEMVTTVRSGAPEVCGWQAVDGRAGDFVLTVDGFTVATLELAGPGVATADGAGRRLLLEVQGRRVDVRDAATGAAVARFAADGTAISYPTGAGEPAEPSGQGLVLLVLG